MVWHPGFMAWFFTPIQSLGDKSICVFIMNSILVSIRISIQAASLLLPLLVIVGEWSLRTRCMMAVIPVTSIIFLASFLPSVLCSAPSSGFQRKIKK